MFVNNLHVEERGLHCEGGKKVEYLWKWSPRKSKHGSQKRREMTYTYRVLEPHHHNQVSRNLVDIILLQTTQIALRFEIHVLEFTVHHLKANHVVEGNGANRKKCRHCFVYTTTTRTDCCKFRWLSCQSLNHCVGVIYNLHAWSGMVCAGCIVFSTPSEAHASCFLKNLQVEYAPASQTICVFLLTFIKWLSQHPGSGSLEATTRVHWLFYQ